VRRILSVRPSVCLSVVGGRKYDVECGTADWSDGVRWGPIGSQLGPMGSDWVISYTGGGRPLLTEILGQPTPIGTKSPIFNQ